jgi:outer membrane protein TolC
MASDRRTRRPGRAGLIVPLLLVFTVVTAGGDTLTLRDLFGYVETASTDAALAELAFEQARRAYERERAIIYPTIDLSAPLSYGTTLSESYTTQLGPTTVDVEHSGGYSIGLSPTLSVRQALPTGGTLSASLGDTLSFSDPGTYDPDSIADSLPLDDRPNHTLTFGLGLDQPLYFGGSAFSAALETAENGWTRSVFTHERTRNQLQYDAAQRFFRLQYLGYALELVAARYDAAVDRVGSVEREAELGLQTESTLLQARLAVRRAEIDLLDAERAHTEALSELQTLYQIPADTTVGSRVETMLLPDIEGTDLVADGLANNLDFQILRLAEQDSDNAVIIFDSGRAPRLSVGVDLTYTDLSEEDAPNRSTGFRGNIAVSANLFDGGADRNRREELLLQSSQARLEIDRAADSLQRQITQLLADLQRSSVYLDYLLAARDAALYELERGTRDHELGVITDRGLQELELELESARLEIARATVDENVLKLGLLLMLGRSIPDSVTMQEEHDQ